MCALLSDGLGWLVTKEVLKNPYTSENGYRRTAHAKRGIFPRCEGGPLLNPMLSSVSERGLQNDAKAQRNELKKSINKYVTSHAMEVAHDSN